MISLYFSLFQFFGAYLANQGMAIFCLLKVPLGVAMVPRGDGGCMVIFDSSCPVSVYMVIGWGSQPLPSYNLEATTPGVGMDRP